MKYLSLFSGVGGFDQGADAAGWNCVGQVEWDKHAQQVLQYHWPDVPKWGDVRDFHPSDLADVPDVVVGGFPCQDVSIAGRRAGIGEGTRSGLYGEIIRIIKELHDATDGVLPRWVVLENVRGLLSHDKGASFGMVLDDLADLGALVIEWGLCDTQFFGPPQRRQRVFVVACFDPATARGCPDPLLPLTQSLPRDPRKGRRPGKEPAAGTEGGPDRGGLVADTGVVTALTAMEGMTRPDLAHAQAGWLVPQSVAENQRHELRLTDVVPAISSGGGKPGRGYPAVLPPPTVPTLTSRCGSTLDDQQTSQLIPIGFNWQNGGGYGNANDGLGITENGTGPLTTSQIPAVALSDVRRLTPVECERLQGWGDDWTLQRADGKTQSDAQRYKQIGNGISAPVARWVCEQLNRAESGLQKPDISTS